MGKKADGTAERACYFGRGVVFELFDPEAEFRVSSGCHLPHWFQPGVTYFVTFRTGDSIPTEVSQLWHRRRDDWLRRHGVEPSDRNWRVKFNDLPTAARREIHETFSREYLDYLDQGHGECVLKAPEMSAIVGDSLRHFDGSRYHMGDFVVMPNHVHLVCCLLGETEIEQQCESWKHFTAHQINRRIGAKGRFWQEDSFDHLVRSEAQFEAIGRYIASNPRRAKLTPGEYLHYQPK